MGFGKVLSLRTSQNPVEPCRTWQNPFYSSRNT
jgi:hypothetical protein